MRRLVGLLYVISTISILYAISIPGDNSPKPQFASDRFLVKLTVEALSKTNLPEEYNARADNFGIPELDALMTKLKATAVIRAHIRPKDTNWEQKTGFNRWFVVEVPVGTDILKAVDSFSRSHWIEQAEPDHYFYPTFVPNDTFYSSNWGHNNTRQLLKWSPPNDPNGSHSGIPVGVIGFDSNAQDAWDFPQGTGSTNIVIAVIDTGFDRSHPDLRFVTGYDFGCGDPNPDFMYNSAHGTCCAGIAAAKANNSLGVTGIAGGCSIMPLKILDWWGYLSSDAIRNSIVYAADNGAEVISMSFGSTNGLTTNDWIDGELGYANDHGITLFAAVGNDCHYPISYPAYSPYVISVAAGSPDGGSKVFNSCDGEYWWGSNWGTNTQDNRFAVDITGPTILPTTDIIGGGGYDPGDYEMFFNGTSCACPYVAGVAALLKARNPSLTPAQIRIALTSTAFDMYPGGNPGWDCYTGYGFVDAAAALGSVPGSIPYCNIYYPGTLHGYVLGETININVNAYDAGGSINRVEFFLDNTTTPAYTDTTYPYTWSWNTTGSTLGMHYIKAKAYDSENIASPYSTISATLLNPATDGFESTYLSTLPWINAGDADWEIEDFIFFSGQKAVYSGNLTTAGNTSTLYCSLNFISGGSYSFYRKVVSNGTGDYLRFYIDNVLITEWTGNQVWTVYTGTITGGVHTLKWVYTQGGGNTHYGRAFLDHLILPAYSANTNPDIQWWPNSFTENLAAGTYSVQTLHISNWNSPTVNFLAYLPCSTQTLVDETFTTTSLPFNWQSISETGSRSWVVNTGGYNGQPPAAYDGMYNARLTILAAAAITRLTIPYMDLSLATSATLTFWHTQAPVQTGGTGGLGVYYKTSAGGAWTLLESYSTTYANWTREVINLPNLCSTYYISFLGAGNANYCICLDKIAVTKQSYAASTTTWCRFETTPYITGSIGPMSFYSYMVQFSAVGLTPGTYTSQITITSNCTANPTIIIPLTLNVYDPNVLNAPVITEIDFATSMAGDAIELLWNEPPGFPDGYNIYRAFNPDFSDSALIGNVPSDQTWFSDPVEFTDRKAFYRVTAVRD